MAAPFTNPVANTSDALQVAMVKLAYWLELTATSLGSTGTTSMFLPSMAASHNDSLQVATVKAAYWAEQVYDNIGSAGGGGITVAAGDPPLDGSITTLFYKNSTSGVIFVNSGTAAVPTWDPV